MFCLKSDVSTLSLAEEYRRRLERWRAGHTRCDRQYRQLGNARLVVGIGAVAIAALALGAGRISAWWLLLPLVVFIVLAIVHDRVDRARAAAGRAVAYWERAEARLANQWVGKGSQGERFRDPRHVYAEDLDLFGRGSLFELLSSCRTSAGENILAHWLLAPGEREEILDRQRAVEELGSRVDLREELAVMGEDIRAAVDAKVLGEWAVQPPVAFFRGARVMAFLLACAAGISGILFLTRTLPAWPFLTVVFAEIAFGLAVRESVGRVVAGVTIPARELKLLRLLLERLERESFHGTAAGCASWHARERRKAGLGANRRLGTTDRVSRFGA